MNQDLQRPTRVSSYCFATGTSSERCSLLLLVGLRPQLSFRASLDPQLPSLRSFTIHGHFMWGRNVWMDLAEVAPQQPYHVWMTLKRLKESSRCSIVSEGVRPFRHPSILLPLRKSHTASSIHRRPDRSPGTNYARWSPSGH